MITGHGWAFSGEMIKMGLRKKNRQTQIMFHTYLSVMNNQGNQFNEKGKNLSQIKNSEHPSSENKAGKSMVTEVKAITCFQKLM